MFAAVANIVFKLEGFWGFLGIFFPFYKMETNKHYNGASLINIGVGNPRFILNVSSQGGFYA